MTEQNMIPAEKVRELIEHFEGKDIGIESYGILGRFRALLPASPQPTTGLLGRWAKHPEHGDVVCVWDEPMEGHITVHYRYKDERTGTLYDQVPLASLMFPEQATKPEEVPAGEAWLVELLGGGGEQRAFKTAKNEWQVSYSNPPVAYDLSDGDIILIAPLTPERPGKSDSDLQTKSTERALDRMKAKYDELKWEYKQAQAEITWLKAGNTPRIVATEAEYAALPIGSIASKPDTPCSRHAVFKKIKQNKWERTGDRVRMSDRHMAQMRLPVLRYGRGDEQLKPAWRIEHDLDSIRVGEYIIDCEDDDGTVTHKWREYWDTDGDALGASCYAPFIVFPSKDAATPEAVAEAKRARDKETDK